MKVAFYLLIKSTSFHTINSREITVNNDLKASNWDNERLNSLCNYTQRH
jgi:hypothetical protein